MSRKILILITPAPLFTAGEEFLTPEIPVALKYFDKIISIHHSKSNDSQRVLPREITEYYFPYLPSRREKIFFFSKVISVAFWKELIDIIFVYKLFPTRRRIATLLGAVTIGENLSSFISALMQKNSDDKFYVYSYWCNFSAVGLAFLKKRKPDVICISRAHGYDVYFERNIANYLPMRKLIYQCLDRVYFISKTGLSYAIKKSGQYSSMKVSHLGCNDVTKQYANSDDNIFWLVSCSSAIPLKRIDLIIKSLSTLNSCVKLRWWHIGDGPLMNELSVLASRLLKNKKNIEFDFRGYLPNNEVVRLYSTNKVDLFINVSESEGIPFSIMEAFASGIPAIATNVGATAEIVENGYNGYLLSSNPEPEEVCYALLNYIALNDSQRTTLSQHAKLRWKEKFNAEKNYESFYNDFV